MNNKCQVFTPSKISKKMLEIIGYKGGGILQKYILENSCGEGNILTLIVERYIKIALRNGYSLDNLKKDLEKYIIGYHIDPIVISKCTENLNVIANKYGLEDVKWNLNITNYLYENMELKVDYIIGNPPYISYQEINLIERKYLKSNFSSCSKGRFDYCYAFIEKSISNLNEKGKMVYIIPNSIFKNSHGNNIREIIKTNLVSIFDYRESTIFENALTSPAIIYISKSIKYSSIKYIDEDKDINKKIRVSKQGLLGKWIFSDKLLVEDESENNVYFGDLFKVSNSVATLLNKVFIIKSESIISEDIHYIIGKDFKIEKELLRQAASPRSIFLERKEYIIFPYKYPNGVFTNYNENEFSSKFPFGFCYLKENIKILMKRSIDGNTQWFEYGRNQALKYLNQEKLMLSSIITKQVKCYKLDENVIPYSGFYIVPIGEKSLDYAKKVLESKDFLDYISFRGINANGVSIRCSVKDIMNYKLPRNDEYLI